MTAFPCCSRCLQPMPHGICVACTLAGVRVAEKRFAPFQEGNEVEVRPREGFGPLSSCVAPAGATPGGRLLP